MDEEQAMALAALAEEQNQQYMDDGEGEEDEDLGEGEDEYEDAMVELTDEQYRELVAQQNQGNMLIDQQEGAALNEMQLAQAQQMQQL